MIWWLYVAIYYHINQLLYITWWHMTPLAHTYMHTYVCNAILVYTSVVMHTIYYICMNHVHQYRIDCSLALTAHMQWYTTCRIFTIIFIWWYDIYDMQCYLHGDPIILPSRLLGKHIIRACGHVPTSDCQQHVHPYLLLHVAAVADHSLPVCCCLLMAAATGLFPCWMFAVGWLLMQLLRMFINSLCCYRSYTSFYLYYYHTISHYWTRYDTLGEDSWHMTLHG